MIAATVIADVAAEVEIPENGTLSRVLFKDDHLRLVAFGFDAGQELTDHTAGVPVTLHLVRGLMEVDLDGDVSTIGPEAWVHIPAGMTHAVRALEPSVMVLALIRV